MATTNEVELTAAEMKLLINKPDELQEQFTENMSRTQRRRLERVKAKDDEERARYGGKMATRMDVVQILALYIERNLLPLAHRLDGLEAEVWLMKQWFWKRWWLRLRKLWSERKKSQPQGEEEA